MNLLLLLILGTIWGSSYLFIKVAVAEVPVMTLIAGRLLLAAIILWILYGEDDVDLLWLGAAAKAARGAAKSLASNERRPPAVVVGLAELPRLLGPTDQQTGRRLLGCHSRATVRQGDRDRAAGPSGLISLAPARAPAS